MQTVTKEDFLKAIKMAELNFTVNLEEVDSDGVLIEQGLDSLDMANLLFEIELIYNIVVGDEANDEWSTINKIVENINKRLG